MEISPFGAEHLDDAGALLAARHRADRAREPDFPPRFESTTSPTSRGASFIATRAGFVTYAGHAVDAEDALDVSGALYARLGTSWVEAGCLAHYVQVAPTDAAAEQRWHALGFGRESVTAPRRAARVIHLARHD